MACNEPLDGRGRVFRLFTVKPDGEDGGLLHCSKRIYSVDEAPPYRAVSYTWGAYLRRASSRSTVRRSKYVPTSMNFSTICTEQTTIPCSGSTRSAHSIVTQKDSVLQKRRHLPPQMQGTKTCISPLQALRCQNRNSFHILAHCCF